MKLIQLLHGRSPGSFETYLNEDRPILDFYLIKTESTTELAIIECRKFKENKVYKTHCDGGWGIKSNLLSQDGWDTQIEFIVWVNQYR